MKQLFLFSYNGLRKAVSLNHWHSLVFQYFSEFSTWKPSFCLNSLGIALLMVTKAFGWFLHLCRWKYITWGSELFYLAAALSRVLGQRSTFVVDIVVFLQLLSLPYALPHPLYRPESIAACASGASPAATGLDPAWSPDGFPSHPARLQLFSVTK